MDRRSFLKSLFFSSSFLAPSRLLSKVDSQQTRWAFFSDIHIPADSMQVQGPFHLHQNLKNVVRQILDRCVQGAIITGDLARTKGLIENYQAIESLLNPLAQRIPVGMALGNHDHRQNFLSVFKSQAGMIQSIPGRLVTIFETSCCTLILLDSLLDTHVVAGFLGNLQREWLAEYLGRNRLKPTLLFLHHHLSEGDDSLLDRDQFLKLAKTNSQVKGIFYGHTHRFETSSWNGIQLVNLPAVAYNFSPDQPVGWVEAALSNKGGKFTLHAIAGSTALNGNTIELNWR